MAEAKGNFDVQITTAGSAGYVLVERVAANLAGKTGSFLLRRFGLPDRGEPAQNVVIIPDSGTGELAGIAGRMSIDAAANHAHVLRYSFRPV